jgi:hypothetical protein
MTTRGHEKAPMQRYSTEEKASFSTKTPGEERATFQHRRAHFHAPSFSLLLVLEPLQSVLGS